MQGNELNELIREAERLRVAYLDAVNRGDLEAALRVGAEELVPISEQLAEADPRHNDPFGMTLLNLSAICDRLQRDIGGFYFIQRAFAAAMWLDLLGLPMNDGLANSVASRTATFAARIAGRGLSRRSLPESESRMIVPAAALVPESIEAMSRLDEFVAACRLRVAATRLRELGYGELELVDHESRSMVWLARFALARGDRDFVAAELGEALTLWVNQLDSGGRYWSTELGETWTVAADLLDTLLLPESAAALLRATEQAVHGRHGVLGLSGLAEILDLREHYRAALAGMGSPGRD